VRPAQASELEAVAWLRAEAFYEDQQHLRYVGSFKRQFMEQEARSLRQRTKLRPGGSQPECVCLVCLNGSAGSEAVVGTLDAEPPASSGAAQRPHVPEARPALLFEETVQM
jgi:hypothetical protein